MCGIVGIFKSSRLIGRNDKIVLRKMSDLLKHRGPDGEGAYEDSHCLIGHRRLAIIDLEKGRQPMFNEDASIVIAYNGEIYNYQELRKILIKDGHKFSTESDTEVIIHGYEEWGENVFTRLSGMFAISLYDRNKNLLYLVRDRIGMKPLYYWHKDGVFVWASEIKAILLYPSVERAPNLHTIVDFTTFQNTIDEKTFFKDIYKLLPGYFLKIHNGCLEFKRYWDLDFNNRYSFSDINEASEIYKDTFKRSVRRHLVSDVEIGSCLSGGFDSSSVAFSAPHFLDYPLKTFTGYFAEGKRYDERNITKTFEKFSDTQNTEIQITAKDFRENIEKVMYHLDEPTLGSGAFPHYIVAKEISKHVKVVLTGHGGDELFAGYQVYKASFYKDLLKNDFSSFLRFFWKNRPDEIWKVLYFSFCPLLFDEVKYGLFVMFNKRQRSKLFTPEFLKQVQGYSPAQNLEDKYLKGKNFSCTEQTLYLYLKTYLPTLFIQEDKVGMAHSIESRMPMCDNEMVELSARIPYRYKLYNNELKYLTKAMMKDVFPKEFYKHPKMGFPTPIAGWFKKELRDFVFDILTSKRIKERGIFNVRYIKKLLDSHFRWSRDTLYDYVRANKIYSLLSIELWFRTFIDQEKN